MIWDVFGDAKSCCYGMGGVGHWRSCLRTHRIRQWCLEPAHRVLRTVIFSCPLKHWRNGLGSRKVRVRGIGETKNCTGPCLNGRFGDGIYQRMFKVTTAQHQEKTMETMHMKLLVVTWSKTHHSETSRMRGVFVHWSQKCSVAMVRVTLMGWGNNIHVDTSLMLR